MSMWREVNIFRGAHRLVPVLGRSTRTMPSLIIGWVRGDVRIRRNTQKLEKGETVGRFVALVFIGYVLVYVCVPRPWTWWLWAAAWFLACCVIAAARGDIAAVPPGEPDAAAEQSRDLGEEVEGEEQQDPAGEQQPTRQVSAEQKAVYLSQLVEHRVAAAVHPTTRDAPAHGDGTGPHVHGRGARVRDILTTIQKDGSLPSWDVHGFASLLKSLGIPVREQMYFKVDGRKTNAPGVHIDDLTAALGRQPRLPARLVPDHTSTDALGEAAPMAVPTAPATTPAAVPDEGAN